eukprot:1159230-Pelagomonas_calceolata.AAC.3
MADLRPRRGVAAGGGGAAAAAAAAGGPPALLQTARLKAPPAGRGAAAVAVAAVPAAADALRNREEGRSAASWGAARVVGPVGEIGKGNRQPRQGWRLGRGWHLREVEKQRVCLYQSPCSHAGSTAPRWRVPPAAAAARAAAGAGGGRCIASAPACPGTPCRWSAAWRGPGRRARSGAAAAAASYAAAPSERPALLAAAAAASRPPGYEAQQAPPQHQPPASSPLCTQLRNPCWYAHVGHESGSRRLPPPQAQREVTAGWAHQRLAHGAQMRFRPESPGVPAVPCSSFPRPPKMMQAWEQVPQSRDCGRASGKMMQAWRRTRQSHDCGRTHGTAGRSADERGAVTELAQVEEWNTAAVLWGLGLKFNKQSAEARCAWLGWLLAMEAKGTAIDASTVSEEEGLVVDGGGASGLAEGGKGALLGGLGFLRGGAVAAGGGDAALWTALLPLLLTPCCEGAGWPSCGRGGKRGKIILTAGLVDKINALS